MKSLGHEEIAFHDAQSKDCMQAYTNTITNFQIFVSHLRLGGRKGIRPGKHLSGRFLVMVI